MNNKVCVILVNYNGKKYNDKCIRSVLRSEGIGSIQIVIADNASTDGSLEELQDKWGTHPQVKIISLDDNYGFSKANNVGIEWAMQNEFSYILLLNNDTEITSATIKKMIKCQEETGGIIVPKVLYADRPNVIWCAGGFFTPVIKKAVQRGLDKEDVGQFDEVEKCSFANGCCMLLTREIVEQVGNLDERFFLYYEDTEYSLRALRVGVEIWYCGQAVVYHKVNGSTGGNAKPENAYYITRNWLMCNKQHMGRGFVIFVAYYSLNRLAWGIIWGIQRKWGMINAMWRGIEDFRSGRIGKF